MRNYILNTIASGVREKLGNESTEYDIALLEEVTNRIPERVTVNRFAGVSISETRSFDREIGKSYPVRKNHACMVAVLVKNADFGNGQDEVDIIANRIFKYFALDSSNIGALSLTRDGITEKVIGFNLENVVYGEAGDLKVGQMGNACLITVNILTEITI